MRAHASGDFSRRTPRKQSSGKETELVLGGGGVKGFGHVGLLRALEDRSVAISTITGVSIGSIIGTLYLNGYIPEEIEEIIYSEMVAAMSQPCGTSKVFDTIYGALPSPGQGNLKDLFKRIVDKYNLHPHPDLRIVAFSLLGAKPIVFEGLNYDLSVALASSCALPLVMRPVMLPKDGEKPRLMLVDGGLHHPNPGNFCKSRAIISKLGFASLPPTHELSPIDYFCHLLEQSSAFVLDRYFYDPVGHIVIPVGMPDVSGLSFRLPKDKCLRMAEYGYAVTQSSLNTSFAGAG
jgi:hypothetical protein